MKSNEFASYVMLKEKKAALHIELKAYCAFTPTLSYVTLCPNAIERENA